jgi:hypothetical protein
MLFNAVYISLPLLQFLKKFIQFSQNTEYLKTKASQNLRRYLPHKLHGRTETFCNTARKKEW